jgi:hypothetical protein
MKSKSNMDRAKRFETCFWIFLGLVWGDWGFVSEPGEM